MSTEFNYKIIRMKKYIILILTVLLTSFGLLFSGCDDNMPEFREIAVEKLALGEALANGLEVEKGETEDISSKVILTPLDATDRAENYSSSNPEVAIVSGAGIVTANAVGSCDITIWVGGKSVTFQLTVIPTTIIPIKEITLAVKGPLELKIGELYNLGEQVVLDPIGSNEDVVYTSSAPEYVFVNSMGELKGVKSGSAIVTVAAKGNPTIKTELKVDVTKFEYSSKDWLLTVSHTLPITGNNVEGNSLFALLDGDFNTNLCLVRPGKKHGTAPNRAEPAIGEALHFTIDMLEPRKVSYFRLRHRNANEVFLRWHSFDQILGSDDGENFEVIATDVKVVDVGSSNIESPDIEIPLSTYRYIKFYGKEAKCFFQSNYTSQGNTVQIQELYLGYRE